MPRSHLFRSASPLVVAVVVAPLVLGQLADPSPAVARGAGPARVVAHLPAGGVFGPRSAWRLDVRRAPLGPDSAAIAATVSTQVRDHWGGVAAFNDDLFTTATYTVPRRTRRIDVVFDDCQHKGYQPTQLVGRGGAFRSVPIPARARPAGGSDGNLAVYSPSADRLWELWKAHRVSGRWHACWGGRIDHASRQAGYFGRGTGVSASGVALSGGIIRRSELRRGRIDHAMSLSVTQAANWRVFSYPAQRSDGSAAVGTRGAVPEGIRLRLDPRLDLASLQLTRVGRIVARAAQRYGFIVTDQGGAVAVSAERGSLRSGTNPAQVLRAFPWDRLQALPMDYGRP
ncbi:hypothetical protein D9V37_12130 [Nocardioides mangrovicus]|uniref:Uncharacterized protein n=1 Tax=Nocardioides mangrovicus TaxID=2478913 RepID=A0A3L8P1P0_9ACTN|nr:hypothetical protein [Nocardioides mangrovicus]RLV49286.1 hypothetical protein D9V37_12130 [Nocardioides mangrovicus]